jgi:hypothetical protein
MDTKLQDRINRFLPCGIPKYIRCYKSKEDCLDPYTVVFTGNYTSLTGGSYLYVGMGSNPYHPQGIGQHGSSEKQIDTPMYGHLGKRITFGELPEDCQKLVLEDYKALWNLNYASHGEE